MKRQSFHAWELLSWRSKRAHYTKTQRIARYNFCCPLFRHALFSFQTPMDRVDMDGPIVVWQEYIQIQKIDMFRLKEASQIVVDCNYFMVGVNPMGGGGKELGSVFT